MADRYVWSGAGGSANGSSWANAHLTMAAAITASTAGDVFYVAHDHAESTAGAVSLGFKGTSSAVDRVFCADRAGTVPPVAADLRTTAEIATTGANSLNIGTANGTHVYIYGVIFKAGSSTSQANIGLCGNATVTVVLDNCQLVLNNTNSASRIILGATGTGDYGNAVFKKVGIQFGATGQGIFPQANVSLTWDNADDPAILGATVPSTFIFTGNRTAQINIRSADLSLISGTLVGAQDRGQYRFIACKLHASVTIATAPPSLAGAVVEVIGSGSASNVSRNERHAGAGVLTTETTIVRTAGASDGVTPSSWKIVSNSKNRRDIPFETFEGVLWNDNVGSPITLTIHTVTDNITLTDAEIWLEVDYLGDASFPVTTKISDAAATPLTAGSNQASDSGEAWTTTGLTTPVKQKLEATFTPLMAGLIRWRVKYAKASSTVYVCHKPDLS